jgi:putative ABC transport system permease protein
MNDLKFAFRQLVKNPGFAAVAVLTLALGIGATTSLFSVVYGVVINPYPYARPGEIWAPGLRTANSTQTMRSYRQDEFLAMSELPVFSDVMATSPGNALLTGEFAPESLTTPRLSANGFQFLGVAPVVGRTFGPGDFSAGGEPERVTVISYRLWQRLFGGSPDVIGRVLRFDDQPYTIVGVMPSRFGWWTGDGAWLPLAGNANHQVFPIARLKPGVAADVAREQWHALQSELARTNPSGFPRDDFESTLTNYLDITVASGELKSSLQLLFGAVGFLLLIACANVANLQLARATARAREMAIRLSVGAGRSRLMRQLLTESVLLSCLGGVLGLAFALAITKLMVALMPGFYVPNEARIEINGFVLVFCIGVSMLTGIAFGLAPALQSSRPDLTGALKDEGRGSSASSGGRFRAALVVTEMALSVVLLVSAGLTIRSFVSLVQIDPGFRAEQVLTASYVLPPTRYATFSERNLFGQQLLERVWGLPGVLSAQLGNGGLPFGGPRSRYAIHGQAGPESQPIRVNLVSTDYLKTLGIPLRAGQMFGEQQVRQGDRVAVINETAAMLWPAGENPIGGQIHLDLLTTPGGSVLTPTNSSPEVTVIGIIADTRNDGLRNETQPLVLVPYTLVAPPDRSLAIRSAMDPDALAHAVREVMQALDSQLPLRNVRTIDQALADQTVQPRFTMTLFSLFAAFGLVLATVGMYSVLSYIVGRRTREIGVRMALGAQRRDVLGLILKDGGRLAGLGLAIGAAASVAAGRFMGARIELFQVGFFEPVSFLGVILILGFVAAVACWLPARRAAKVDPMEALRSE